VTTVLRASPRQFVSTPAIERVAIRALRYLQSGFSVHLRGPAGTGKTTLALHLADLLTRPIMLIFGDDEFKTSDLIGNQSGYTRKKVVDNYIHTVMKVEDEVRQNWVDSRLTLACREGFTLVYDEFNRSRPEVNNVLLSALEEKLLVLPPSSNQMEYIRVNPNFRAIFTSNPEEYCGVHSTQDALMDRLVTINIPEPDELTQQEILVQKTEIARSSALFIVRLVKAFRQQCSQEKASGLRASLVLAKIAHEHQLPVAAENSEFRDMCADVLLSRSSLPIETATQVLWKLLNELVVSPTTSVYVNMPVFTTSASTDLGQDEITSDPEAIVTAAPAALIEFDLPMAESVEADVSPLDNFADFDDYRTDSTAAAVKDIIIPDPLETFTAFDPPVAVPTATTAPEALESFTSVDQSIAGVAEASDNDSAVAFVDFAPTAEFIADTIPPNPLETFTDFDQPAAAADPLDAFTGFDQPTPEFTAEAIPPDTLDAFIGFDQPAAADPLDTFTGFDQPTPEFATETIPTALESLTGLEPPDDLLPPVTLPETTLTEQLVELFKDLPTPPAAQNSQIEPRIPYVEEVLDYLLRSNGVSLTEIESSLGLTRLQVVDAVRTLIKQDFVIQRDRRFFAQVPQGVGKA
jgi:gas vesicle protein GvpN